MPPRFDELDIDQIPEQMFEKMDFKCLEMLELIGTAITEQMKCTLKQAGVRLIEDDLTDDMLDLPEELPV